MTKTMSRLEVDDILSSIRKLVSDKSEPPRSNEGASPALLLLTPAQRIDTEEETALDLPDISSEPVTDPVAEGVEDPVAERQEPEADWTAEAESAPEDAERAAEESPEPVRQKTLAEKIAELEAAVGQTSSQFEPDGSEEGTDETPEVHVVEFYRDRFRGMVSEIAEEAIDEGMGVADTENEAEAEADAETQDFADQPVEEEEGPDAPLDLSSFATFSHRPPMDEAKPADEPSMDAPEPAAQDTFEAPAEEAEPEATAEAEPQVAEPAAVYEEEDQLEAEPEQVPVTSHPQNGQLYHADDELLVDEAILREMVTDIVREELQGRLGERITRNVRRMVRLEIEKAFSMRNIR